MKRILVSALAAAAFAASALPASAWDRGWSPGAAVAVGAVSGLALGAAIGAAANPYYPGKPVYVATPPRRVYVETVEEAPVCTIRKRRYVDEFGDVTIRRIRVCD